MDKFLTKENIIIAVVVIWCLIESNYFATKLDLSQLRNEVLQQKIELQKYSDDKDEAVLQQLDIKYEKILQKLEVIQKNK